MLKTGLLDSGGFLRLGCTAATAEQDTGTEYEAKVIPVAVIMHLVHMDPVGKQRYDEGERSYDPVPKPPQKSCALTQVIGYLFQWVALGKTGG